MIGALALSEIDLHRLARAMYLAHGGVDWDRCDPQSRVWWLACARRARTFFTHQPATPT